MVHFSFRVNISFIHDRLRVEHLLLCEERSQLSWFEHFIRMPLGHHPLEVFPACPARRSAWSRLIQGGETLSHSSYTPHNPLVNVYIMLNTHKERD